MNRALTTISAIASTTFRECIRSKILYTIVFFALTLILVASLFGMVTIGDQTRVVKDFALFSISLGTTLFVLIAGSSFVSKELGKKTIFNILSKNVSRWHFLVGKYLGMLSVSLLLVAIMGILMVSGLALMESRLDVFLLTGLFYICLELTMMSAIVIFFSAILVTPLLAGVLSAFLFIVGRSAEYLLYFVNNGEASGGMSVLLKTLYWSLPNLSQLNVADLVVYHIPLPYSHFLFSALYTVCYSLILLIIGAVLFTKREFR